MLYLASVLFDIPSASQVLASTGDWSLPIFEEFQDLLWPIIGVGLVVLVFGLVIKLFQR